MNDQQYFKLNFGQFNLFSYTGFLFVFLREKNRTLIKIYNITIYDFYVIYFNELFTIFF